MALKTAVKINRITHLTDARYCSGMYVDVLGFSLESSSPHFISPTQFKEITGWVSGVAFAAEFTKSKASEITALLEDYPGITYIESENLEALVQLQSLGVKRIFKVAIEDLQAKPEKVEVIKNNNLILHLTSKEAKILFDFQVFISEVGKDVEVFLGFGVDAENAVETSGLPGVYGFALDSGEEIKPGLRDFEQLADLLESLEIEN